MPAVPVGDMCVWVASPDTIVKGSTEVLIQRQGRAPTGGLDGPAAATRPGMRPLVGLSLIAAGEAGIDEFQLGFNPGAELIVFRKVAQASTADGAQEVKRLGSRKSAVGR